MQRLQAFKYELMPNGETQRQLRRFAGSCRFVYNKALALQQANHEAGEKFISSSTQAIAEFFCQNSAGYATAIAAMCWENYAMSRFPAKAANGLSASKPSAK
jgi:transposase